MPDPLVAARARSCGFHFNPRAGAPVLWKGWPYDPSTENYFGALAHLVRQTEGAGVLQSCEVVFDGRHQNGDYAAQVFEPSDTGALVVSYTEKVEGRNSADSRIIEMVRQGVALRGESAGEARVVPHGDALRLVKAAVEASKTGGEVPMEWVTATRTRSTTGKGARKNRETTLKQLGLNRLQSAISLPVATPALCEISNQVGSELRPLNPMLEFQVKPLKEAEVLVVTDDDDLGTRCRRLGALTIRVRQFMRWLKVEEDLGA